MQNPESFWLEASKDIHWDSIESAPALKQDGGAHSYTWFPGRTVNACYNCIDIHVDQGRGKKTALVYDSPVTDTKTSFSYQEMQTRISEIAGTCDVFFMVVLTTLSTMQR